MASRFQTFLDFTSKTIVSLRICVVAVLSAGAVSSALAVQAPIPGIGWNEDMVVGVSEVTGATQTAVTASMDNGTGGAGNGGGFTWYQLGQNLSAPTTGLPMGTTFTSAADAGTSFTLQAATVSNAILVDGSDSGTFTLSTPAPYSTLSFLASTGSGNNVVNYTIDFVGGGTESGTFTSPDWFNNTPVAIGAGGRINASNDTYDQVSSPGGNPNFYEENVSVAGATEAISSIAFSLNNGGGHTAIMAVSGTASVIPEPTSLAAMGGLVLLAAGRRRARGV